MLVRAFIWSFLLALLAGCAADSSGQNSSGRPLPQLNSEESGSLAQASFPKPSALASKGASALSMRGSLGSNFDQTVAFQNCAVDGTLGVFSPSQSGAGSGLEGLAYGLYRLRMANYSGPSNFVLAMEDDAVPQDCWIGIANFAEDRWR